VPTPRRVQRARRPETEARYRRVLESVSAGNTLAHACRVEGYNYEGFIRIMYETPDLRERYEQAKRIRDTTRSPGQRLIDQMSLPVFRSQVLGRETYPHMSRWSEWMDDPTASHVLIVTAPGVAKTQFIKDRLIYGIARKPTLRAGYASLSWEMAKNHADSIRKVIEENVKLREVAGNLRPESDRVWSSGKFMVAQRSFDTGEDLTDPTLTAFGAGSQVASVRLDEFYIDDIDGKDSLSPGERLEIFDRITSVYEERLEPGVGRMYVVCNRWDELDVAGHIINYAQENPGTWKVYVSPAIIRERDRAKGGDWGEVIFPERFGTETGKVGDPWTKKRAWEFFEDKRLRLGPRKFALRYQNDPSQDTERDFTQDLVQRATDRGKDFSVGDRPVDAIVICSQDPAGDTGGAATLALSILGDGRHLVTDAVWGRNVGHSGLLEWVRVFGQYRPLYWGIEGQGGFALYTKDKELGDIIRSQRASLISLITNQNKNAEGVGVTSLIPVVSELLIIPSKTQEDRERMEPLVRQLLGYRRAKWDGQRWVKPSEAFDLVMALWLAERVVRERRIGGGPGGGERSQVSAWRSPYADSWQGGSWRLTPPGAA
jgi:hypothetical protein